MRNGLIALSAELVSKYGIQKSLLDVLKADMDAVSLDATRPVSHETMTINFCTAYSTGCRRRSTIF